jgi:hypothetical protein
MNSIENNQNLDNNNDNEIITIKIRTMDKEFEIQIKKTLTIRALKEKIEEVIHIIF